MLKTDAAEFATIVQAIAAAFRQEPTEAMTHGYWLALDDLELPAVRRAAKRALRECKFMPTASELRELAGDMRPDDRAVLAWDAFERAVVSQGGYRSVDFDDRLINATVRSLGGWQRCCEMNPEQFDTFLRKDFERIYATLCRTGVSADRAAPLLGIHASEAAGSGHALPSPIRIETGLPAPSRELIREAVAGHVATSGRTGLTKIGQVLDATPLPPEET